MPTLPLTVPLKFYSQIKIRIQLHIPTASLVISVFKFLLWQHSSQHWWCFEGLRAPQGEDLVLQSFHSATSQSATSLLGKKKKKKSGETKHKHLLALHGDCCNTKTWKKQPSPAISRLKLQFQITVLQYSLGGHL